MRKKGAESPSSGTTPQYIEQNRHRIGGLNAGLDFCGIGRVPPPPDRILVLGCPAQSLLSSGLKTSMMQRLCQQGGVLKKNQAGYILKSYCCEVYVFFMFLLGAERGMSSFNSVLFFNNTGALDRVISTGRNRKNRTRNG